MLDFNKINKDEYEVFFSSKNLEDFNLQEFNNYVMENGVENYFDKCLLIDWAKKEEGWQEIDSPNTWIRKLYEENEDIFEDSENPEHLKKEMLEKNFQDWNKQSQDFFNDLESGTVPQGLAEWSRNYVCYAYEIINFKKEKIIAHDIYCVFDKYTVKDKFYSSFDELHKDIEEVFLASDWGTDFIETSFG